MNRSELSHTAGAVDDSTINIVVVIIIIIIIKSKKHIGLQTKLLSSCLAFIQSRRQTNVVTFSGKRAACVLPKMYPEELNSCSHGTDVAGTHNTVFTKFAKTG